MRENGQAQFSRCLKGCAPKKDTNLATQGLKKKTELESSGFILEPTGAQFAENGIDLQALICSAPEFDENGYPTSSPAEIELDGDHDHVSATSLT